MTADGPARRALPPLLLVSGVAVLVTFGFASGFWLQNLHNGLLALAFTCVGAYVLFQRPGHRVGALFMATGVAEAVLFFGRQMGRSPASGARAWLGWLGVWPVAIALALTTISVICFPDGRLISPRWRWTVAAVAVIAGLCACLSAVWPVEYESAGVRTAPPVNASTPDFVAALWSLLAHPAYVAFQVLWVVAVVARWRSSAGPMRSQLSWLVLAAVLSVTALLVGLAVGGTASAGLLSATLIPLAAGWSIVHGQHVAAYSALTWLSRGGAQSSDLSSGIARAVAQALNAPSGALWMGKHDQLHAVGVWPETSETIRPATLAGLLNARDLQAWPVSREGEIIGALSIDRPAADQLSVAEQRLLDELAAQAALVIDHQTLADIITTEQRAGYLDELSPREQAVLDLMARGLSNAAICSELHLSIKTVEPAVSTIFRKLRLHPTSGSNRRVLAVLAYLRS